MRRYLAAALAIALSCISLLVLSQPEPSTPAATVTYHQQSAPDLRDALRRMKVLAPDRKAPLAAALIVEARTVQRLVRRDDAMVVRRVQEASVGRQALKELDGLWLASQLMLAQAVSLVGATERADPESFRAAVTTVAQACAACHLDFRIK